MSKQNTRERILLAAEKLFSKNGYNGVTTKVLAKESGITEMTLFNHFPQKEILYKTVVKERYMATDITSVFNKLTYSDLETDLKIISNRLIQDFLTNKNILMMRLKEKENFESDSDFSLKQDPVLNQLMPIFKLYDEKDILKGSSESIALLYLSSIKGLFYVSLINNSSENDVTALVDNFVSTLCHGCIK